VKARAAQLTVCRWDLDKTYLETSFESLRDLIKVPFEKGSDKKAVPGVVELIRGMRRCSIAAGYRQQLFFISASPPQISRAIREKLRLDGVEYEGISFKHQVRHLVRGRLDLLREQVGFKLERLLAGARRVQPERANCCSATTGSRTLSFTRFTLTCCREAYCQTTASAFSGAAVFTPTTGAR
jgi:hypothetical protein